MPDRTKKITLFTILLLSFFGAFGNPLIIPLFPQIRAHFGIMEVQTTLLVSMYALPGAMIIPVLGFLEDRLGRKPILLAALIICVIACIGMSLAESFTAMLAWRMLLGFAVTPMEALCNTLIADNFSPEERVKYIGHNMSALYAGVAAFPLISTGVMYLAGWRAALMSPVILAVPLIFLCLRMRMPYRHSEFNPASYRENLKSLLLSRKLLSFFGIRMFIALIMFGAMHSYMPFLVTEKLGASDGMPGVMMALFSVFMAMGSMFLGYWSGIFGQLRLAVLSGVCLIAGMLGLMLSPGLVFLFIPVAVFGAGIGVLSALTTVKVSLYARANTKATILSVYSSAFRAAQTVSPFLCSLLFMGGGFTLLYGVAAALSAFLTWFVYVTFKNG